MPAKRDRLLRTLQFEYTGRVPLLGGWILGDHQQQAIVGVSEKAYWQDPERCAIEAHRALDIDGMIMVVVPAAPGGYRDKYEHVYLYEYAVVPELEKGLHNYFTFYNYERPHQSLAYQTPAEVHFARVN